MPDTEGKLPYRRTYYMQTDDINLVVNATEEVAALRSVVEAVGNAIHPSSDGSWLDVVEAHREYLEAIT